MPRQKRMSPSFPFWRTIVLNSFSTSSFPFFSSFFFRAVGRTTGLEFIDLPPSGASSHEFSLRALGKFTSYQVVARAYNTQGEGPASTSVVATTLEDGESVSQSVLNYIQSTSLASGKPTWPAS